ncbi:hypothetical protein H4R24_004066 [Coemansia sp. RSA 988]|nr:hypothetical protein H4R24_004066 [Coemansia sp. RSA 988]
MTLLGPLQILVMLTAVFATAVAQTTASTEDGQKEDDEGANESRVDILQMDLLSGIPTVGATIVGIIQLVPPPIKRQGVHLEKLLEWLTDRIENDFMVTLCSCAGRCHTQTYEPNAESLTRRIRSNIGASGINRCTGSELLTAEDLIAVIQEGSGNTLLHMARLAGYPHMNQLIRAVNIIQYSPTHGRSVIIWQLLGLSVMYYIPRLFGEFFGLMLHFWRVVRDCFRRIRNRPPIDRSYTSRLAFDYRMADLARHRMIFQHTPWVRFGLYYILMELQKKHMSVQKWTDGDQRGDDSQVKVLDTFRMDYMLEVALLIATDKCSATRLLYSIALHSIRVMSLFRYVGSSPAYVVSSSFTTVACRLNQTSLVISHEKINALYWHMYPPANADQAYASANSHHAHSVYDLMIKVFCSPMGDMVMDNTDIRVLLNLAFMDLPISKEIITAAISPRLNTNSASDASSSAWAESSHHVDASASTPAEIADNIIASSLSPVGNLDASAASNLAPVRNTDASAATNLPPVSNTNANAANTQTPNINNLKIDGIFVKPRIQPELCKAQVTLLKKLHKLLKDFNTAELFWGPQPWLLIITQAVIARLSTNYPDSNTTEEVKDCTIRPRIIYTTIKLLCFAPFQLRFQLGEDGKQDTSTVADMWALSQKTDKWDILENGYCISMPSWCLCNDHCRGICTLIVNELKMSISVDNYFRIPYAFCGTVFPFFPNEVNAAQQPQSSLQSRHPSNWTSELPLPLDQSLSPVHDPDAQSFVSSGAVTYNLSEDSESDQRSLLSDTQARGESTSSVPEISTSVANNHSIASGGNREILNSAHGMLPNTNSQHIPLSRLSMNFRAANASTIQIPPSAQTDNTFNVVRLICVPSLEAIEERHVEVVNSTKPRNILRNPRFDISNYQLAEIIYKNEPLVAVVYGDVLGRTKPCSPASLENGRLINGYPNTIDEVVKNDQQALNFNKTQPLYVSKSDSHKLAISTKIREPSGLLQYQHSSRKNERLQLLPDVALPIRRSLGDSTEKLRPIKVLLRCTEHSALRGLVDGVEGFMNKQLPISQPQSAKSAKKKAKNMFKGHCSTLAREPVELPSDSPQGDTGSNRSSPIGENVRYLTGVKGIGKSYLMKELVIRVLFKSDNARVVYIANCEEWANQPGWEGQLDYFVTAIKIAFSEDKDFQSYFRLGFARSSNKASMCTQVLESVVDYCKSKATDLPLRVLFCVDNYDALLKPKDGERFAHDYIRELVKADPKYFFLVLSTSRNQHISDFVSRQLKVPTTFNKPEVAGATKHFANPDLRKLMKENKNLFFDIVRRSTENNPRAVMQLLNRMSQVGYSSNATYYTDLVEAAAKFKNSPSAAENEATVKDYVGGGEQGNADETTSCNIISQKLVAFCAFNNIYFNAESISSEFVKQDPLLLFHPFITPRRQHGINGSSSTLLQFSTPRTGAHAMELVFNGPRNGIIVVSAFFGNGSQEKYYMGYAGTNLLISSSDLEKLDSDEFRFHTTQTDMHMLDIKESFSEREALEKMANSFQSAISCSGVGSVAFHTHAARDGEPGPSKGVDFVIQQLRGNNMMAYVISAPYVSGADVNNIIDNIEKFSVNPDYSFKKDSWSSTDRILIGINTIFKMHQNIGKDSKIVIRLLTSSAAAKNQRWNDLKILKEKIDFMAVGFNTTLTFADIDIPQLC